MPVRLKTWSEEMQARTMLIRIGLIFCLPCGVLPAPAFALSTYCVNSAGQLDAALAHTQDDDVRINLVQGSYDMRLTRLTDGLDFDLQASLTIVGGYGNGCGSRSHDAALTTLYADPSSSFVFIGSGADITLSTLTIQDFSSMFIWAVDPGAIVSDDHDLQLDRVRLRNGGQVDTLATDTYLNQVSVTGSSGGCALRAYADYVDLAQVEDSLFADNAHDGFCIGSNAGNPSWGVAGIYNTIFWNNGGVDIRTRSDESQSDIALRYNIYQGTSIVPGPASAPVGTLDQNPQFVDAGNGDYRLGNASPAKDSGSTAIPGGVPSLDIQGLQRIAGSGLDRGPYENQSAGTQFIYTVTNTNDANTGSFRQALLDSESNPGLNGIVFNIPGSGCPKVINVLSPLPAITQSLNIDGLSQPGSSGSNSETMFNATLCVLVKDGASVASGLVVGDTASTSASVTIKGLGFSGFGTTAIDLRGGSGHFVVGDQFAGSMGGNTLDSGNYAIRVTRLTAPPLSDVQIGGDDTNQRNLIGNADAYGILLNGDEIRDTQVINNLIGFQVVDTPPFGASVDPEANLYGIVSLGAIDTTIRDNWISGNTVDGIFLNGSDAYVTGNHVGISPVADFLFGDVLPNGGWGVRVTHSGGGLSNNVVGSGVAYFLGLPVPVGKGNTIANNTAGGIRADGGLGHRFSRNLLFENGRPEIDIAAAGFTFNDNDGDAAATGLSNRGLNTPLFSAALVGDHTRGTLHATLDSTNGLYRIEVFSSPACYSSGLSAGAARFYHGAAVVQITNAPPGQNGSAAFTYQLHAQPGATPLDDRGFVMLAIDADGNTSELSLCLHYQYSDVIFADGFQ
jgi:hypothetical protein